MDFKSIVIKIMRYIYYAIKEDLVYIIGNYGLRIASLVFTILVAKKISPENYGVFGLATLIITYIGYFNLGSQYSINKELSINKINEKAVSYAFINILIFSTLVVVFGYVISFFDLFKELHPFLYYLVIYPILFNILEISNGILRAYDKSKQLGVIKLAGAISVIFITIFYFLTGVNDEPSPLFSRFLLFLAIEVIVSLYFFFRLYSVELKFFKFEIDWDSYKYLILQGLLLSLYVTIDSFTKSIDRLFIASFYSKSDLGLYSFGVSLQGPFLIAIGSIMYMDFSRILKKFKSQSYLEFNILIRRIYKKLFLIWSVTLLGAMIICYFFLKYFIVKYYASYLVVIIYIFNYSARILVFPYTSFFIANDYHLEIIKISVIPSILNILLSFFVVKLELPYIYIIVVSLPSNLIYYYILKKAFKNNYFME